MNILKNNGILYIAEMKPFQKIALSLLATLALFSAFFLTARFFAFKNDFEAKFYRQTKIQEKTAKLNKISRSYTDYFSDFLNSIRGNENSFLNLRAVCIFYDKKPSKFNVALFGANGGAVKILGFYKNATFEIPRYLYFAILAGVFISLFLILFLIFSLKRDSDAVLKEKIKKLQIGIIRECFESGEKINLEAIYKKLESRKNDFSEEIVKSLKIRSKKKQESLNLTLEKNWKEIFSVFQTEISRQNGTLSESQTIVPANLIEEIRKVLKDASQNSKINIKSDVSRQNAEKAIELEELREVDGAKKPEEIGKKEIDAVTPIEKIKNDAGFEESSDEVEVGLEEIIDVEELVPLDGFDDFPPKSAFGVLTFEKLLDTETFLKTKPKYAYALTNETYFASDDFATVDNVFAEEICLGSGVDTKNAIIPINFKQYKIEKYWNNDSDDAEPGKAADEKAEFAEKTDFDARKSAEKNEQTQNSPQNFKQKNATENSAKKNEAGAQKIIKNGGQTGDVKTGAATLAKQIAQDEEIENLTEEVQLPEDFFSMTEFAENVTSETPMLDAADAPQDAVIQEDGIFTISQQADYKNSAQDKDFKALVDSVL